MKLESDQLKPLLTRQEVAERIAAYLKVSVTHAYQRIVMLPDFPAPACHVPSTAGGRQARWDEGAVNGWLLKLRKDA